MTIKDDIQYGRARTTKVDHFIVHERDTSILTRFTAINLKEQVSIFKVRGWQEFVQNIKEVRSSF
ncbi:hypothetical protein KSD_58330 [Ktedonobacter sp. SOSP1-85]|uniref:hypothetical protein n=1 Tax=Ktedonobacter sp. SOSP1-85 TaxID=2778367 RepID=UPI00191619E8|nr:hypothetical protein [Ktedonobacter sp. SOSP1-85]GHO78062.1 hypothetical protein KSD_58330 [Ktedonobacter sp. SOSP1-85]